MKKFTALAISIGFCLSLAAQDDKGTTEPKGSNDPNFRSWSVGLNVGANYLLGDYYVKETNRQDFNEDFSGAGLSINGNLTKWVNSALGFQGELGYNTYNGSRMDYAFKATSSYRANINVMLNLNGFGARNRTKERKDAWILHTGIGANYAEAAVYQGGEKIYDLGTNEFLVFFDRDKNNSNHRSFYMPMGIDYHYRFAERWDAHIGARGIWYMDDNADGSVTTIIDEFPVPISPAEMKQMFPNSSSDWMVTFRAGVNYYFAMKTPKSTTPIIYTDANNELEKRLAAAEDKLNKLMKDGDDDGVSDYFDKDPNTAAGVIVDGSGRGLDIDGDGVKDADDEDPFTTKGAAVDAKGRELDADGDGVPDGRDLEPNTKTGSFVNFQGVTIVDKVGGGGSGNEAFLPNIYFDFNKSNVTSANYQRLAVVARFLNNNPNVKLQVVGHTDKVGSESYNVKLSDRRAAAAVNSLVNEFGIDRSRLEPIAKGKTQLTSKRDDINRRVEFHIAK